MNGLTCRLGETFVWAARMCAGVCVRAMARVCLCVCVDVNGCLHVSQTAPMLNSRVNLDFLPFHVVFSTQTDTSRFWMSHLSGCSPSTSLVRCLFFSIRPNVSLWYAAYVTATPYVNSCLAGY